MAGEKAEVSGTFALEGLPGLTRAALTVMVAFRPRSERLDRATVMVEGETAAGAPIAIAVHLDPEPRSGGACGHALAHCHVGPTLESVPKIRVPFPLPGPVHALDWALSQLVPDWEPAPWPPPA